MGSGDYVSMLVREGAEEVGGDWRRRGGAVRGRLQPGVLREGSAIYDSLFPDRIVVGAEGASVVEVMRG